MSKNDHPHSQRLIDAICDHCGTEVATSFAAMHPLSKSADIEKKFRWACDICTALEAQFDADTAASIRRDCHCGNGKTMANEIAGCISRAGTLSEGCTLFSCQNKYAFLEYVSEQEVVFGYHTCVCSCVKRVNRALPMLWCECSAGYVKAMFTQVFGSTVLVTLLGSVKNGSSRCTFRVSW